LDKRVLMFWNRIPKTPHSLVIKYYHDMPDHVHAHCVHFYQHWPQMTCYEYTEHNNAFLGVLLSSCFLWVDTWLQFPFFQHVLSKCLIKLYVSTLRQYKKISCTNFHPFYSQAWLNCTRTRLWLKKLTLQVYHWVFLHIQEVQSWSLYKTVVITTQHCIYHSLASRVISNSELSQNHFSR
jgi:hypothetical protein